MFIDPVCLKCYLDSKRCFNGDILDTYDSYPLNNKLFFECFWIAAVTK